jgi:hypothetical protein
MQYKPTAQLCIMIILFAVASSLFIVGFVSEDALVLRTWTTALLGLLVLWLYLLISKNFTLRLRTPVLVVFGISVMYFLPPLYFVLRVHENPLIDRWNLVAFYPTTNLLVTIGTLIALVGYDLLSARLHSSQSLLDTSKGVDIPPQFILIILIAGVTWIARIWLVSSGGYYHTYKDVDFHFGRWGSLIGAVALYGILVPIILWLWALRGKIGFFLPILATLTELAWVLPSGSRGAFARIMLIAVFIVWHHYQRFPRLLALIGVAAVLLTMPFMGEYRNVIRDYSSPDVVSFDSTIQAYQDAYQERLHAAEDQEDFIHETISRLHDGVYTAYILQHYHSRFPWAYGETYYSRIPKVLFPAFVLPELPAPQVHANKWFPHLIYRGSVPLTFFGEAYVNFGYIGILSVPLLWGGIFALWDHFWQTKQHRPYMFALYLLSLSHFVGAAGMGFVHLLTEMRRYLIVAAAIYLCDRLLERVRGDFAYSSDTI